MSDPFVEAAARYSALSEEYTAEVLRLREQLALAGHRGGWPHGGSDCFVMQCSRLWADLLDMQARVLRLDDEAPA